MRAGFLIRVLFLAVALCTVGIPPVLAGAASSAVPNSEWQTMIAQIDGARLYQSTYDLQNFTTRVYPSSGNTEAAAYLYNRLDAIPGLEVEYQSDKYHNVIATLPGTGTASDTVVIVGAHYDSYSTDPALAPGAWDNGIGAAIVLELARVMSTHQFTNTIQFACWNVEEASRLGSRGFVHNATDASLNIPLYLNLDGSGYDPNDQYDMDIIYNEEASPFADLVTGYNSAYGLNFDLTFNTYDCSSDHRSFWESGYPGIWTHSHPHASRMHSPTDTIDLISFDYAKKNAQLGALLLATAADPSDLQVVMIPGASGVAQDLNDDGLYDDVNGNGRADFADVVLYFNQMTWITANEPVSAFDYNSNGRIDFADVVWLFNAL
jgi:PKD repeat protein